MCYFNQLQHHLHLLLGHNNLNKNYSDYSKTYNDIAHTMILNKKTAKVCIFERTRVNMSLTVWGIKLLQNLVVLDLMLQNLLTAGSRENSPLRGFVKSLIMSQALDKQCFCPISWTDGRETPHTRYSRLSFVLSASISYPRPNGCQTRCQTNWLARSL